MAHPRDYSYRLQQPAAAAVAAVTITTHVKITIIGSPSSAIASRPTAAAIITIIIINTGCC